MENENPQTLSLNQSLSLIIERERHNDWLWFVSPEGLRLLHLRFEENNDRNSQYQLMFKRCPELKKFYPQIRNWFAEKNLSWKDISINKQVFMVTALPPNLSQIEELVLSAQADIFDVPKTFIGTPNPDLSIKLSGIRAPITGMLFGFVIVICLISYVLYQLVKIPSLGLPSIRAMKWEEVFMIAAIPIGVFGMRLSGYQPGGSDSTQSKRKDFKLILKRSALFLLVLLGFCTY